MGTILASLILLVRLLPVDRLVALLSAKVESLGVWGPATFAAVYVLAAVLFVPGSALTLAAGAVFGLVTGTIVVSLASTTAAAVSFLIGRYLARDTVHQWAARNPSFAAIDRAIGQGGWKIIALLRLSPAMPFSLGNYLFGVTSIRFWPYVLTSWLAMLPGTFMYVYLGYAGRAGLGAAAGAEGGRSPAQWVLLIVGLAATIAVTIYVTRLARKAVKENTAMPDATQTPASADAPAQAPRSPFMATMLAAVFALALAVGTGCAYANRAWIAGLFGPPAVAMGETYTEKPNGASFDHSAFDAILKKHVNQNGGVNYAALIANPKPLLAYNQSLAEAPWEQLGRDEKLALLINAYNSFTLQLMIEWLPKQGIDGIRDIPASERWDAKRWNIAGNVWSLNQIEHEQIRPHFKEPRIHWAVVCAAVGCPPLRPEAYMAQRLDKQLADQEKTIHIHGTRWFRFDPDRGALHLTQLYNWYGGDFEQAEGSVIDYVSKRVSAVSDARKAGKRISIRWLDYDWSLNNQENLK